MYSNSILYVSQFRDSSGYASAARSYVKAVDEHLNSKGCDKEIDFRIYTVPIEHTNSLSQEEDALLKKYEISELEIEDYLKKSYTMVWHMPATMILIGQNFVEQKVWSNVVRLLQNSNKNINMTVWEASSIPSVWKENVYLPLETESVIVPSSWNKEAFSSGLGEMKCDLLPHVIEDSPDVQSPPSSQIEAALKDKFVIFTMSQWQSRKGFDKLIQSYCMEFKDQKDVVLVIKTYGNLMKSNPVSVKDQASQIAQEIKNYKNSVFLPMGTQSQAEIVLLPYVLPFEQISYLQKRADLFALLTRGEGFGLTIAEAVAHGTPIMVPDAGGHMDYVDLNNSFLVEGHWSPYINKPEYNCDMNWYEPHILSARQNMRKAYDLWKTGKLKNIGENAKLNLDNLGFDRSSIGKKFIEITQNKTEEPQHLFEDQDMSISQKFAKIKEEFKILNKDYEKKIQMLHNAFQGEDCYILTCGPSLKEYDFSYLKEKLKDKLVFTVKQTFDDFGDISNFHFFNSNNFSKFSNENCISVGSSAEWQPIMNNTIWKDQNYDIFLKILQDKDYNRTVAVANSFEEWLLEKTIKRPWGPGIMYETVLHFAYHLGAKNIYTIGWDFEKLGTTKSHHYYNKEEKHISRPADQMKPQEIKDNIKASLEISKWLNSKSTNLFVTTENSYVHKEVERKKI